MIERGAVYTDAHGVPIAVEPDPDEYSDLADYVRDWHEYCDKIRDHANRVFDKAFRRAIGRGH